MCIYIYIYITRLASNETFLQLNKVHQEVGRAKDLSAPRYTLKAHGEGAYGYDHFMLRSLNTGESVHITYWCVP
jgi:hypothetical protein